MDVIYGVLFSPFFFFIAASKIKMLGFPQKYLVLTVSDFSVLTLFFDC